MDGEEKNKLIESENKYKNERDNLTNILNSMEDGVYIVNQQYDIEFVNSSLMKEFGLYEGKKCYTYFHDRFEVCPWCKNQDVFEGKTVKSEWYSFKNQKTYDLIDTPLKNPDGSVSKLEIFRDITDRKNTEQKLKESEVKYRHLFNTSPYAIWLVNLRGVIVDCNDTMNNFLSIFKIEDLIGKSFRDVIRLFRSKGDQRFENLEKGFKERFKRLLKQGYLEPIEFEISRGDGKTFWISLETTFVKGSKESLIQLFIKDITKRKEAELKIKESEEKLKKLNKELEQKVEKRTKKLKESEERYREAYNLVNFYKDLFAHDMSNILQSILSTAEYHSLFRNDLEKLKDFGDIYELVKMHVGRGSSLISKVRTLSKLEETEINLMPIGVFDVLDKSVENTKKSFHEKNVNVTIEGISKDLKILGGELLIDVFDNLLNNTVKFSDKDKEIIVDIIISKIQADDIEYIKFEFKDNGIGIPEDRKKTLFQEIFERDKNERGMGIGLSLVKKIVDKYEGKIWVEDRIKGNYKEGSNFVVLLKESS